MKALKKLAVLLSSAVMMTSFSGVMPYNYNSITVNAEEAAEAEITVWDGTSDTSWYDAEETELYISTAEELAGFASLVNNGKKMTGQTIYLENDILLNETNDTSNSWKTIGPDTTYYFDGTFDGQNYTISGLYDQGLFGYSGSNSIIRNINVDNATINNSSHYSNDYNDNDGYYWVSCYAVICGYNNGEISNCNSKGTLAIIIDALSLYSYGWESHIYSGGTASINNGVISNCTNEVIVSTDCTIKGSVPKYGSYRWSANIYSGGIIALNKGQILKCSNNADVSSVINSSYSYSYPYEGTSSSFYACSYAGGICGLNESSYISECSNSGDTYSMANTYYSFSCSYAYSGGICGYEDGNSYSQHIDNCYNTGKVGSETTPDYSYAGGIVGYSDSGEIYCKLCNLYNVGEVVNADYLGGIIGYDNYSSTLTSCYYLNSTALKGVGNKTTDSAISKSEANMKTASFAESLGGLFAYKTNNYPVLLWEADFDIAKIEETDISLTEYNQQKTLTLKTNYEETPAWISSDTNIATVENGVVTAKNNGECTIYAVCGEARAECKVTVDYEYRLNWASVKLEPKLTSNLKVISDKTDIAATGFEIEWTSSDESVATVENGTVVAVKAGTATITASFGDNKLECEITVNSTEQPTEAPVPALNFSTIEINEGETAELVVNNYTGNITWISDNTMIATVTDGLIKAKSPGTANIYAMLSNGTNLICKVTVNEAEVTTTVTTKITTTTTTTTKATTASKTTSETTVSVSKTTINSSVTSVSETTSETIVSISETTTTKVTTHVLTSSSVTTSKKTTTFISDGKVFVGLCELKAETNISAKVGDTVYVPVYIDTYGETIAGMAARVVYDENALELTEFIDPIYAGYDYAGLEIPYYICNASTSTFLIKEVSGEPMINSPDIPIVICKFKVLEGAKGEYEISFENHVNSEKDIEVVQESFIHDTPSEYLKVVEKPGSVIIEDLIISEVTTSTTQQTTSISTATTQVTTTTTHEPVIGDVNNDDKVNIADVVLIQKTLVKIEVDVDFSKIDINKDGNFNVFDLIIVKRLILTN